MCDTSKWSSTSFLRVNNIKTLWKREKTCWVNTTKIIFVTTFSSRYQIILYNNFPYLQQTASHIFSYSILL